MSAVRDRLILGQRFGVRVAEYVGPWASLGVHVHAWPPANAQIVLHVGWWVVVIGRHYGAAGIYRPQHRSGEAA